MKFLTVGTSVRDNKDNEYILDEIIGEGGFGCVFKAHRISDKKFFAVKTMLTAFNNIGAIKVFKNEITIAMGISGENVIQYEYAHNGEEFSDLPPYIIMEYANGNTLKEMLEQRKKENKIFTNDELTSVFKQLSNGMNEINKNLVHRDVKPENILICDNIFKISDFGLSKISSERTRTMSFKGGGTPLYMAPEAWNYTKNTIQMDIYSMGIVFYELATLKYPYNIPDNGSYDDMHFYSAPTNPNSINAQLSPKLSSLIIRMLEKHTQKRFKDWNEIINFLGTMPQISNNINDIIATAINRKNQEDIATQNKINAEEKLRKEQTQYRKLIYSQFESSIYLPIQNYVDNFNSQYAGNDKIILHQSRRNSLYSNDIELSLTANNKTKIEISLRIIFENTFSRKNSSFMGEWIENYTPQYKGINIMAWGKITNTEKIGYNLLLVKNSEIYGEWFIFINTNSGLSQNPRNPQPFAFDFDELPKEINKINSIHIYNSEIKPLTDELLLSKITEMSFYRYGT